MPEGLMWGGRPAQSWGAYHGSEIVYVFNAFPLQDWAWRPVDLKLGDAVSSVWVNFAKTGSPNGPGLPEWPAYDAKSDMLMNSAIRPRRRPPRCWKRWSLSPNGRPRSANSDSPRRKCHENTRHIRPDGLHPVPGTCRDHNLCRADAGDLRAIAPGGLGQYRPTSRRTHSGGRGGFQKHPFRATAGGAVALAGAAPGESLDRCP